MQASDSRTPSSADPGSNTLVPVAATLASDDTETTVSIVELWNQAFDELRKKESELIKKYEEQLSWSVSTIVGATVTVSG